jgi:hypothetical protein
MGTRLFWSWSDVLKTPFVNAVACGSRVLVTTRHDLVAKAMKARERCLVLAQETGMYGITFSYVLPFR